VGSVHFHERRCRASALVARHAPATSKANSPFADMLVCIVVAVLWGPSSNAVSAFWFDEVST